VRVSDAARLAALAAIWGAAYIFIRVAAPALGPFWTTEGRLVIGAAALSLWFYRAGIDTQWRRHLRFYALFGLFGTAVPFTLFSFAGMQIAGSTMAILNTTAPMFALLVGAAFGLERLSAGRVGGLLLGAFGVWLVAGSSNAEGDDAGLPIVAVGACLCASFLFAATALIVRRWGRGVPAAGLALGAQVVAAVAIIPFLPLWQPAVAPSALVLANLVALGLLGSGVAYVLYFRLIADIGAASTQTVSLLTPGFGLLWGALFL
jgi:drug/metabolite transporter (DMT)-like permease